jgi:hypothetical protein
MRRPTTMTSPSRPEPYETRDMTEAAYLSLCGHSYELVRKESEGDRPIGAWAFVRRPNLDDDCLQFRSGAARVEPVRFQRKLTEVRRQLYDFLGLARGRKR